MLGTKLVGPETELGLNGSRRVVLLPLAQGGLELCDAEEAEGADSVGLGSVV